MRIIDSIEDIKIIRDSLRGKSVGFIPTMGALHLGHQSLIQKSIEDNDVSIVSIFVNPTQFDNKDDLVKYPNMLSLDCELLEKLNVDYLFLPDAESIYPDQYNYKISEENFSKKLCGKHRDGHFDGVLTIVMKLFNLIRPTVAYFGQKDFQQLKLIKEMTQAFFLDIDIRAVETVRASSGLALSSRNKRLSPTGLKLAAKIYEGLSTQMSNDEKRQFLEKNNIEVEYLESIDSRTYIAARIEGVRLIDNI